MNLVSRSPKSAAERQREYAARQRALGLPRRTHMTRYGITPEEYVAMFEAQRGVCKACGLPERAIDNKTGEPRRLAVDHCHDTGKVRGLLCLRCNRAIGLAEDDPARLRKMADYLESCN